MTGLKIVGLSMLFGAGVLAQVDPLKVGALMGEMAPSAILSVALIVLYRDSLKDKQIARQDMKDMIAEKAALIAQFTDMVRQHARQAQSTEDVMNETRKAIEGCLRHQGAEHMAAALAREKRP